MPYKKPSVHYRCPESDSDSSRLSNNPLSPSPARHCLSTAAVASMNNLAANVEEESQGRDSKCMAVERLASDRSD